MDLEVGIGQCSEGAEFHRNMSSFIQVPRARATLTVQIAAEDQRLRAAWGAAWLREYRCHIRYVSLLALDAVEDIEVRLAWLDWWNAACVCREALRRLEISQFYG
jgi:hypothetical protein